MKKFFISQIFFKNSLDDPIISLKKIVGLELRGDDIIRDFDSLNFEVFKNLKKEIIIHSSIENVNIESLNEWERVKSVREVEKSIPISNHFNAKYLIVHPSGKVVNENRKKALENSLKSLNEIKEFAKLFEVQILVENLPFSYLADSFSEMKIFVDNGFDICFDLGHSILTCDDFLNLVKSLKDKIKILHFHSNDKKNDLHLFRKEDFKLYENVLKLIDEETIVVFEFKDEKENRKNMMEFLNEYTDKE